MTKKEEEEERDIFETKEEDNRQQKTYLLPLSFFLSFFLSSFFLLSILSIPSFLSSSILKSNKLLDFFFLFSIL